MQRSKKVITDIKVGMDDEDYANGGKTFSMHIYHIEVPEGEYTAEMKEMEVKAFAKLHSRHD